MQLPALADPPIVICREMTLADADAVCALLTKGFAAWRDATFWSRAIRRLAERSAPDGLPKFGYVIEASGAVVGVLLLIASEIRQGGQTRRRCNVSSWYVEPDFRLYGTLLVRQALRHRDVTYLNITPAPETWKVLAAQGYERYAAGRSVLLPLLATKSRSVRVTVVKSDFPAGPDLDDAESVLLREHAGWDCLVLVCQTEKGRVPFVFGLRRRHGIIPFAYLIYSRGLETLADYARPLGWALARRGILLMVADTEGPVPGIPGWFETGHPKFFRGNEAPHPSDLAYTERAVFGT